MEKVLKNVRLKYSSRDINMYVYLHKNAEDYLKISRKTLHRYLKRFGNFTCVSKPTPTRFP